MNGTDELNQGVVTRGYAGEGRLSAQDFAALQHAILELHEFRDLKGFRKALPEIFCKIIRSDSSALLEEFIAPDSSGARGTSCGRRHAHRHAHEGVRVRPRHEFALGAETHAAAVSGRDRLLLALLRPHLATARRNAESISRLLGRQLERNSIQSLTEREAEIAQWVAQGKSNPEIAIILSVSPRTIEKHVERILAKLRVENRATVASLLARNRVGAASEEP